MNEETKMLDGDELDNCFAYDPLGICLRELSQYPTLSKEEQNNLARLYKENNDLKAKERLINCNLRLVVNIAMRYKSKIKHFQILDLVQEGTFGLIRAIETYDPSKGAFSTYAVPWIAQYIARGLENKDDEIRKPTYLICARRKYFAIVNKYKQDGLPLPSDDEFCNILDIPMETLQRIKSNYYQDNMVSLNQPVSEDETDELGDIIAGENNDYEKVINTIVDDNLLLVLKEMLDPLQYYIIYYRVLCDEQKTLAEIALNLNITGERVRQIEEHVLKNLKSYMEENTLIFETTLKEIQQREGWKINLLKTTPLTPNQIIRYMYLKDELTDLERKIYGLNLLGKYTYRSKDYASILGITIEELSQVMVTLKAKFDKKFSDSKAFNQFQGQMLGKYGTRIFDIKLKKDEITNYLSLNPTIVDNNLLLVAKEVLTPLQYYIIYYRILSDGQTTFEEIGLNLNITRERVRKIKGKALKKLKPYMEENSSVFETTLKEIQQREGDKINLLKTTPITPNQIIRYMYLKDELTDLERKLYELNIFGKYTYRNEDYAFILGITAQELKQVMVTLKAKINKKFSDANAFKLFEEQMIENYGTRIYDIELMEDEVSLEAGNFLLRKKDN